MARPAPGAPTVSMSSLIPWDPPLSIMPTTLETPSRSHIAVNRTVSLKNPAAQDCGFPQCARLRCPDSLICVNTAVRGGLRLVIGITLGTFTALVGAAFAVLSGVVLLLVQSWPKTQQKVIRPIGACARWMAQREQARLSWCLRIRFPSAHTDQQALYYVSMRWPLGLLGGVVLLCIVAGAAYCVVPPVLWLFTHVTHSVDLVFSTCLGFLLTYLAVQGMIGVRLLEKRMVRRQLGPSPEETLRRRIDELFASRAGVVEAVHDERRRIERDLHDGVQQRLVALGVLLGRALRARDPAHADELLHQAHQESQETLMELRQVAWRVYPKVLDEAGFKVAVETVVLRSTLPVDLEYRVIGEPHRAAAAAAYFVLSEAVTNTLKHARATRIRVIVEEQGNTLRVHVEDDGCGGANPLGGGLIGLARRAAALDGRLHVRSPVGGPTLVTAELPCG